MPDARVFAQLPIERDGLSGRFGAIVAAQPFAQRLEAAMKRAVVAELMVEAQRKPRGVLVAGVEAEDFRHQVERGARSRLGPAPRGRFHDKIEGPRRFLPTLYPQPCIELEVGPVEIGEQSGLASFEQALQPVPAPVADRQANELDVRGDDTRLNCDVFAADRQHRRIAVDDMLDLENGLAQARAGLRGFAVAPQQVGEHFARDRASMKGESGQQGARLARSQLERIAERVLEPEPSEAPHHRAAGAFAPADALDDGHPRAIPP